MTHLGFFSFIHLSSFHVVPPSLSTKPSDQIIVENEELRLQCSATGNPTPKITWIKDGKTVAQGETLSFKPNRSHAGKYLCLAENGLDVTVNATADLDVHCKYRITRASD